MTFCTFQRFASKFGNHYVNSYNLCTASEAVPIDPFLPSDVQHDSTSIDSTL